MLKALLAGAAVTLAIAAGPALAQTTIKPPGSPMPMGPTVQPPMMQQTPTLQPPMQQVVPDEPVTPGDRAQVRRDWNEMAREWQQRERSGAAPSQGSVGAPSAGGTYGGYGSGAPIAPSQPSARTTMPLRGSGMQGMPQEPNSAADRAQVHRDWEEMAREWQQRQRSGYTPPTGQPPLPTQR